MNLTEKMDQIRPELGYEESTHDLFRGIFLIVSVGIVSWAIVSLHKEAETNMAQLKALIPAGGAQIWWSLFHTSSLGASKEESTKRREESRLKRALTSIGRFALRSESQRNPCVICFFAALSNEKGRKELTAQKLGRLMDERVLARHERFRSRVSPTDDRFFEEMTIRDPDHYVTETAHPMSAEELAANINDNLTSKFDVNERLWEAQVSTGPMGSSGAIAADVASKLKPEFDRETVALFRVHHALCDGVSLSIAIGDLCDEAEDLHEEIEELARQRKEREKKRTILDKVLRLVQTFLFYAIGSVIALARQAWRSLFAVDPFDAVIAESEAKGRSWAWRHTAPLTEVKEVAKAVSKTATMNDLFVACLTAALYRQLEEHKRTMKASGKDLYIPKRLNVTIPVHLTGGVLPKDQSLGNKIGAFVTGIPRCQTNEAPSTWLGRVSRALMEGKTLPAPLVAWAGAKIMSYGPLAWAKWTLRNGHARSAAVMSNVRGFPFHTHWNGHRLEHLTAFLPLPPGIPIGMVIQSFAGVTSFTVEADKRAIPDAWRFADWVVEEYEKLKSVALESASTTSSK